MEINSIQNSFDKYDLPDSIRSFGRVKKISKGHYLYNKDDKAQGIFYIEKGLIALVNLAANGSESLLRVFGDRLFIGYRSFIAGESYHASALALTNLEVVHLPFTDCEQLLALNSQLYIYITKKLARDLRVSEERFNDLTGKRVINRVIESLIFLKIRQPDYPWTRKEIGEFCGAKTETVTRVLSMLEKNDLIIKDGRHIKIKDDNLLLKYSEQLEHEN